MQSLKGVRMLRVSTCGTLVVQYNRMQQHDVPYRTHGSADLHGQLFDRPEHSPAEITESCRVVSHANVGGGLHIRQRKKARVDVTS
jgi:hypothetical protein